MDGRTDGRTNVITEALLSAKPGQPQRQASIQAFNSDSGIQPTSHPLLESEVFLALKDPYGTAAHQCSDFANVPSLRLRMQTWCVQGTGMKSLLERVLNLRDLPSLLP